MSGPTHLEPVPSTDLRLMRRLPTVEEYLSLRAAVGWRLPRAADAERALEHSIFGVCALDAERIVGMARVVGDGSLYFYVQDVVVEPTYQRCGLGRSIMDDIEQRVGDSCSPRASLLLIASPASSPFYRMLGYVNLDDEILGKRLRDG